MTNYRTKIENANCSSKYMAIKNADFGDFNINSGPAKLKSNLEKCRELSSCQVKSRCGGKRSCEIMINNFLPRFCSNFSKEIYINFTCVDTNYSTTITTGKLDIQKYINIKQHS